MERYNGPPMTLGNMRSLGVQHLSVHCPACHRSVAFDVSPYANDVPVPAFGPRMVCTSCGMIGADARPDWGEMRVAGTAVTRSKHVD